jgi:hypothetical protein
MLVLVNTQRKLHSDIRSGTRGDAGLDDTDDYVHGAMGQGCEYGLSQEQQEQE